MRDLHIHRRRRVNGWIVIACVLIVLILGFLIMALHRFVKPGGALPQVNGDCGVKSYEPLLVMQDEMYCGFINGRCIVIAEKDCVVQ